MSLLMTVINLSNFCTLCHLKKSFVLFILKNFSRCWEASLPLLCLCLPRANAVVMSLMSLVPRLDVTLRMSLDVTTQVSGLACNPSLVTRPDTLSRLSLMLKKVIFSESKAKEAARENFFLILCNGFDEGLHVYNSIDKKIRNQETLIL